MRSIELKKRYFEWMCRLVYRGSSYSYLLTYLDSVEFTYTIAMDANRAEDGIDLRYIFGYESGYDDWVIASSLDHSPSSVLEMMVALSIKCERTIMDNPDIGDRTAKWFWEMIDSLGLIEMIDSNFNIHYVEKVIYDFLNRNYKRNGEGGLFTVNNSKYDFRTTEIWFQMNQHLKGIF